MEKRDKLYEGKAKIVYSTDDPGLVIQYFKDDATAFNAQKRGTIGEKGVVNNKIASTLFQYLEERGIPTHYVKTLSDREMLIKKVEIIPLEVIVRNMAAGSLCRMLGLEEGLKLACPTFEFSYKDDALNDPLINESHALALELATQEEIDKIKDMTFKVNALLKEFFLKLDVNIVDFKLEFGRHQGEIILADEISPDTCRLWEVGTNRKLDKDRFRQDLGSIEEAYQEILERVNR
ncbi:MAG: phosphoribosylaminoimidazolesuccinocarboxamide synthase [Candidatus Omnitrophota bacterium]